MNTSQLMTRLTRMLLRSASREQRKRPAPPGTSGQGALKARGSEPQARVAGRRATPTDGLTEQQRRHQERIRAKQLKSNMQGARRAARFLRRFGGLGRM